MSGSGGGGGYEYQARATAYVAVHILAEENLRWIENNNPDVPISVAGETGGVGDDLCITLRSGIKIELQAKHGLEKDKLWKPLIKIAKGLKADPKLYGVILTDSTASKTIREDLRNDFKRLGQRRTDNLKTITQETQQKFLDANLPDTDPEFFKRLVIIVLDLDQGLQDGKQAQLLLSRILHNRNQSAIVWEALCSTGQSLNTHEGCRDSKDWARLLCSKGVQLAADCAKANGVMSFEEKEYLESVKQKYQDWWEDSYAFMNEINDAKWQELELTVKIPKSKLNNETNSLSANDDGDKTAILPILDALRQVSSKRVLIVGKAGAGKSTILAKVLLEAAEKALQDPISPIPVLIKLKDYQNQPDFLLLIRDAFERFGFLEEIQESEQKIYIKKLIKDKRLVLLADGVNELSSDGYKAFKYFCGDYLPMIATTRDINVGNLGIQTNLEIQPLSAEKVKGFFSEKLPDYHDIRRVQELCDRVRDFGQTALMVWMLYIIFKQNPLNETPNTRGEAYREFTDIYSREAKDEVDCVDLYEARSQLSLLAFEMTRSEKSFNEGDVLNLIGREKIRKNLLSNHLLQWDGSAGSRKVRFCHPSLQEYYTAEYILAQLPELIDKKEGQKYTPFQVHYLNYLKWTEAIAIMLGFPEIYDRAEKLVELALDVDLMLGARFTGELKTVLQQNTVANVMSKFSSMTTEEPAWLKLKLLRTIGSKVSASHLVPLLDHPNRSIRGYAYLELRQIDPNIIPEQCRAMKDSREIQQMLEAVPENEEVKEIPLLDPQIVEYLDPTVREIFSAWVARELNSNEVIEKLVPMFQSSEKQVRWSAVKVLGSLKSESSLPFLLQAIEDPDSSVIYTAGVEIGFLGSKSVVPKLIQIIEENQNANVRCSAVRALEIIGSDEILSGIIRAMQDPDVLVCQRAVEASERINAEELIPALLTVILHLDPHVRRLAAHRLSNLKVLNQKYLERLVHELENSDIYVRWYIAFTLWYAASEEVIPLLLTKLKHQNPDIRLAVAFALGRFGCQEAVPELIRMMDYTNLSEHPDIQNISYNAAYALGQVKSDAAAKYLPKLFSLISSPSGENVLRAITGIQLNCGFYNYEIVDLAKSETQKTEDFHLSTQGLTIMTDKQPIINFNQNNATIGVNYAAENSNIKFQQNINITEQDLAIAAQKIQAILNQLAQTYPTTTAIQKQDFIRKFLERIESTPDLIKVILAGGIEWVKALCPFAGIPIEMSRSIYEAVKKHHSQS